MSTTKGQESLTGSSSNNYYRVRKSVLVAGTAVLGSVVAVLELTRFLRIPFVPPLQNLKFDIVGIPMLMAYFLFGLFPSISTSLVSFAIISSRDPFSGFMKALAESVSIFGAFIILQGKSPDSSNGRKNIAMFMSIVLRTIVMSVANVLLLPVFLPRVYATPEAVIVFLPFIAAFNAIQGTISIFGGFFVYKAVMSRIPSLARTLGYPSSK